MPIAREKGRKRCRNIRQRRLKQDIVRFKTKIIRFKIKIIRFKIKIIRFKIKE